MVEEQSRLRRSKPEMEALVGRMRELRASGKTNKEIALELNCQPSQVTRSLGAVRQYRGRRMAA